jgi:chromate transporter
MFCAMQQSVVLNFVGVSPLLVLIFAGASSGIVQWLQERKSNPFALGAISLLKVLSPTRLTGLAVAVAMPIRLGRLFFSFLKIGSLVFGSGYVLLAFLLSECVDHLHWLTEKQLIDSVAVGQFTPGPGFATATFVGYLLGALPGAVVATLEIFVPGFVFVAISGPLIPKLRRSPAAGAVLDGVVAGSLALIAVVAWQLGKAAIRNRLTISILAVSVIAIFRFKINSAWLILGAAIVRWIARS